MRWLLVSLIMCSAPAFAAERTYSIGSFERVRVEGPFQVRVMTGKSPGGRVEGDKAVVDQLDITVNGTTLVVRLGRGGWGETPAGASTQVPVVTLTTPRLAGASAVAGAQLAVGRMEGPRVDLSITGTGSIAVESAQTDQLVATVIGSGALSLGGHAARARLSVNGPGTIGAPALTTDDLTVRLEGNGEIETSARYTAEVTTTGLGKVTVLGSAKCIVRASAGGPVACGVKR